MALVVGLSAIVPRFVPHGGAAASIPHAMFVAPNINSEEPWRYQSKQCKCTPKKNDVRVEHRFGLIK